MSGGRSVLRALGLAVVVGCALGLFKGDNSGLRGGIGNLSAPWLLIAAVPALRCKSIKAGALVGLGSTLLALCGFYAALTAILWDRLSGEGAVGRFLFETAANRVYFAMGLVTGPLFGAAAVWLRHRHPRWTLFAAGSLIAGETLVVALVQGHRLLPPPLYFNWGVTDWRPYLAEVAVGLTIVAAALWRNRTVPSHVT